MGSFTRRSCLIRYFFNLFLGRKAIYHATNRDTGSGGFVRVYHVHKGGWTEKIAADDVNVLHYQYREAKGFEEDKSRGKL